MRKLARLILLVLVPTTLAACTSSSGGSGTNGTLSFSKSSYAATSGSEVAVTVSLSGNTDTSGVTVSISTSAASTAVPVSSSCVLSNAPGATSSCVVQVKGLAVGSATLTAAASGVAGGSTTVNVGTTPVPGTLAFSTLTENVTVGGTHTVTLSLVGSSGVSAVAVGIVSGDGTKATVTSSCSLSTAQSTCPVTISGVAAGSATITASATGYTAATTVATVVSAPVPGTLAFAGNQTVPVGGTATGTLSLVGSSNVAAFTATLSLLNANAKISTTTCTLSTQQPSCSFTITGQTAGSDTISAAATGYTGVSMIASVGSAPTPGYLVFSVPSESVAVGATTHVQLSLGGSSGVSGLQVAVSSTANATVTATCTLSTNGSPCTLTITGVNAGSATITASATGYTPATNTVSVTQQTVVTYGSLQFTNLNPQVNVGSPVTMTLQLLGSSNVSDLVVTLVNTPGTGSATLGQSICTLSTANNTCPFQVTGVTAGTVAITTTSTGPSPQAMATLTVGGGTPTLSFSPASLVLALSNVGASTSTVTLANPDPNAQYHIVFQIPPPGPLANSPADCYVPGPPCVLNVNHGSTSDPTGTWSFGVTVYDGTGAIVTTGSLPVTVAVVNPLQRTITMVNKCPFPVYAGIHGGAYGTPPCPSNMTQGTGPIANQCFYTNPVPSNGYVLAAAQAGPPFPSTVFTIPPSPLAGTNGGQQWSGNAMGRINCDPATGNCTLGACTGSPQQSPLDCAVGVGFNTPQTLAEFTLNTTLPDTYDISAENGIVVPTSMEVTGITPDPTSPWVNGIAGSVAPIGNLPKATWTFDPTRSDTGLSSTYYNLVDATAPAASAGDACTSSASCPSQQACGYALNSITTTGGVAPTYTRVCGPRLAYLSAGAVWKGNSTSSNSSPFNFNSPALPTTSGGNTNGYNLSWFIDCPAAGPGVPPPTFTSGYSNPPGPASNTCGCTDWTGIAVETSTCQATNSAWTTSVLPMTSWIKQGCPTCYSYVFDDASSTFTGSATPQPNNAANGTNYTITFCPGGISVPKGNP